MASFLSKLFSSSNSSNSSAPSELEHINQQMYVKNLELAERNKTLSLLRQIDEIILASITSPNEIAAHVTGLLVNDADFKIASISLIDLPAKVITRIGMTESKALETGRLQLAPGSSYNLHIPLTNLQFTSVQAISERTVKASANLADMCLYNLPLEVLSKIQEFAGIKSFVVYPLSVRGEVLGTMMVGIDEAPGNLSEFHRDLLNRLISAIGIALDNAILYNEVQSSNKKLQELDKLKDDFVSLASHELRTPMTAIKSYLWMALDGRGGPLTEKQKYYLGRSYKSTDRLINLVNDMLNISRIESGRITLELQPIPIADVAKEVIDEIAPRTQELGICVRVAPSPALPQVFIDVNKIKEVFFNVIGNSLKFTPKGGTITINYTLKDFFIIVTVTDTGVGISPEDQAKLFRKFGMIMSSYAGSKQVQGTGLGLYISKKIVELHQGQMGVYSKGKGTGTSFSFSLPLAKQKDVETYNKQPKDPNVLHVGLEHIAV
ncbi:hypothetical protein BH11PAT1_BH11PAT1_5500 [soil metagenome]